MITTLFCTAAMVRGKREEKGDLQGNDTERVRSRARSAETRNVRGLELLALLLGLCLLTAIGFAARRSYGSAPSRARLALGALLVAVPLPLALMFHLFVGLRASVDQAAFVLGVAAFGAGAFLLLAGDAEDDEREQGHDPGPAPWWPEFEREFRAYAARSTKVRA